MADFLRSQISDIDADHPAAGDSAATESGVLTKWVRATNTAGVGNRRFDPTMAD